MINPRLLQAYNDELTYLRVAAREFGEEYGSVAGRLGLNSPEETDPYVERLLEGVAFLNARVALKLQDRFPDFTKLLLQAVQPNYVEPTPSMCVVGFRPEDGVLTSAKGYWAPRGTVLSASTRAATDTPVTFVTAHDVTLWPIRIASVDYLPTRAGAASMGVPSPGGPEAALRIIVEAAPGVDLSKLELDDLDLYLHGSESLPGEIYRSLIGDALATWGRAVTSRGGEHGGWTALENPGQIGFESDQSLLPADGRSAPGYRYLAEYFACPERFLFIRFPSLQRLIVTASTAIELVVLFKRSTPLASAVSAENICLFATPAINLFEKQLDRVPVSNTRQEYQVIPDRTRPYDFEVHRVLSVVAHELGNRKATTVAPLYARGGAANEQKLSYVTSIRSRRLSTVEQRSLKRLEYAGTETWLTVTSGDPRDVEAVHDLAVRALVTNRELASALKTDGATDFEASSLPVSSIRCLRPPTAPSPPLGVGDTAWRIISHLTTNYASLLEAGDGAAELKKHLALYCRANNPSHRRQVDGVLTMHGQPSTRRMVALGRAAFARGIRLDLQLDDSAFEDGRLFLFTAVLERFLSEFTSVNSYTECVCSSLREGEVATWPARMGQKPII